ncbi:hypothetical protein Dimus_034587, partial [Dionaea muscipula]
DSPLMQPMKHYSPKESCSIEGANSRIATAHMKSFSAQQHTQPNRNSQHQPIFNSSAAYMQQQRLNIEAHSRSSLQPQIVVQFAAFSA